jgi:hypothetical protein
MQKSPVTAGYYCTTNEQEWRSNAGSCFSFPRPSKFRHTVKDWIGMNFSLAVWSKLHASGERLSQASPLCWARSGGARRPPLQSQLEIQKPARIDQCINACKPAQNTQKTSAANLQNVSLVTQSHSPIFRMNLNTINVSSIDSRSCGRWMHRQKHLIGRVGRAIWILPKNSSDPTSGQLSRLVACEGGLIPTFSPVRRLWHNDLIPFATGDRSTL